MNVFLVKQRETVFFFATPIEGVIGVFSRSRRVVPNTFHKKNPCPLAIQRVLTVVCGNTSPKPQTLNPQLTSPRWAPFEKSVWGFHAILGEHGVQGCKYHHEQVTPKP